MASLREFPSVIRTVGLWTFIKRVYEQVNVDNLFTWASSLAYSWLFAVFPFILLLLSLLPLLPQSMKFKAKDEIATVVYTYLAKDAADSLWINIDPKIDKMLNRTPTSLIGLGLILTIWGASGGVAATMSALDRIYNVQRARPFYRQRPLAIGLTLLVATMIVTVLLLFPIGTIATNFLMKQLAAQGSLDQYIPLLVVWTILRYVIALVLLFLSLALIYYFGPNLKQKWQTITPGAVFSVCVWILLGVTFRYYIDRWGKYNETYGTVAGVAILLLFFYIDAVVLLIGAEINSEIDTVVLGAPAGVVDAKLVPTDSDEQTEQKPSDALAKPPVESEAHQ